MKYFLPILAAIASLGTATAISDPASSDPASNTTETSELARRTPKDKSGNSQIVLHCNAEMLPAPGGPKGEGEGASGQFGMDLLFFAQGQKISPDGCTKIDNTCSNCIVSGGGLSSATNVTACWFPPGGHNGCSIKFWYNGYHYDSQDKEAKCGHVTKFKPFLSGLSAVCYFDV